VRRVYRDPGAYRVGGLQGGLESVSRLLNRTAPPRVSSNPVEPFPFDGRGPRGEEALRLRLTIISHE